jgi:hypothetical protein
MAILAFQKPDKVLMLEADSKFGKFEFRPLEPGFGITVGNALRRILLSSLEGFAITTIKIDGVEHEFSSVESRMRRSALPTVIPKPGSNGRNSNFPNLESASNINTLSGF